MKSLNSLFFAFCAAEVIALSLCGCSMENLAGTGTETSTKAVVTGTIFSTNGAFAANAVVQLVRPTYNPLTDGPLNDSLRSTTDRKGNYTLGPVEPGVYNIEARHTTDGTELFTKGIAFVRGSNRLANDTLQQPGSIIVTMPSAVTNPGGSIFSIGTTIAIPVGPAQVKGGRVNIAVLPSGPLPALFYTASVNAVDPIKLADSVRVLPGRLTKVIGFDAAWQFSKTLVLNTTSSGADITGDVFNFPVLIRLTGNNFPFNNAKGGGEDLRFVKSDGAPLAYEIERWDPVLNRAELWVKMDTVKGNDDTQHIVMYWGNTTAQAISDGTKVFDTANGFQGVWHLSDTSINAAHDATVNRYNGAPSGMLPAVGGAIGGARRFDGTTGYIAIPNSASGKMDFQEYGYYTLSAWVYADSLDSKFHLILSKGDLQYGLQLHNINQWEMFEFHHATGWESVRSPATAKAWKFIAGVRDGLKEYLYVDGVLASASIKALDTALSASSTDVAIGRQSDYPVRYWEGAIDEVCVAGSVRSPDWLRLCFMNQKDPDVLVVFK
jgi:hypothetical protein